MTKGLMTRGFLASSFFFTVAAAYADEQAENLNAKKQIYGGSYQVVIELNNQPLSRLMQSNALTADMLTSTKIISLMRLTPTAEMVAHAEKVAARIDVGTLIEQDYSVGVQSFGKSKSAVDLTMNDVPVLDQGAYGTCVTFASTAVLDALLNKGDFVDQQCSLAHNLFLGNDLWDGAYYASEVIDPLKKHGVVQKNKCSAKYPSPSVKVKTEDYKNLVSKDVSVSDVSLKYYKGINLNNVRQALDSGHRIAVGFQLKGNSDPITVQGFDVKVDGRKYKGGLWACKQAGSTKNYCGFAMAGHEVVIVGYDDKQQLLKIRNSWSDDAGDNGDFYMTYEFFDAMVIDGTEVWL